MASRRGKVALAKLRTLTVEVSAANVVQIGVREPTLAATTTAAEVHLVGSGDSGANVARGPEVHAHNATSDGNFLAEIRERLGHIFLTFGSRPSARARGLPGTQWVCWWLSEAASVVCRDERIVSATAGDPSKSPAGPTTSVDVRWFVAVREHPNGKVGDTSMLIAVYKVFVGLLLATFVGVGIAAFAPEPRYPEPPISVMSLRSPEAPPPEVQREMEEHQRAVREVRSEIAIYSRNVSAVAAIAGILMLGAASRFCGERPDSLMVSCSAAS